MKTVDLHVHSNKSDGSLSPSALVDLAREKGLSAFALTDHDTTEGLDEAIAHAADIARSGTNAPEVIPGIEFSTEYRGRDIHIVGLDIDYKQPEFHEKLQAFVNSRITRNRKMCDNLNRAGIDITFEKLTAAYSDSVITRAHYATYLLEHGYVKSVSEAFDRYVGDHTPYFVPREKVTPVQAVELIRKVGGIPILAHPVLYRMGKDALQQLVSLLTEAGLMGIEVIYSTYTAAETRDMQRLAERNGLLPSGGSDFHGDCKPGLELGTGYHGKLFVPAEFWERLKEKKREMNHE